LAAPWFVDAALGLEVLFTFYVGNNPFLLARLRVSAGGGLDGMAMRELPGRIRVAAIRRAAGPRGLEHPPRRGTTRGAPGGVRPGGPRAGRPARAGASPRRGGTRRWPPTRTPTWSAPTPSCWRFCATTARTSRRP